jgi:hypothetical protein
MKRIILFLLLISFAFAQSDSGPQAIQGAMSALCNTARSLLAMVAMLFILPVIPLLIIGAAIIKLYKGENKTVKLAGKLTFMAGIVLGVFGILGIIVYLLVPLLISILTGMPMGPDPCSIT